MPCKCKKKYTKKPDENCLYCAEKHFSTAMQAYHEQGYLSINRQFIIGELQLARKHLEQYENLANQIRDLRHNIQDRQVRIQPENWKKICMSIDNEINRENMPESGEEKKPGKIYIFSNVQADEENKLITKKNDLLVFLNKAVTYPQYKYNRGFKMLFRRSDQESYGKRIIGINNRVVFGKNGIEKKYLDSLKNTYDWDYEIEEGKTRCMTTGYMVTEYLHYKYPKQEIILVNFGYQVSQSTYRCQYHNWKFEAEQLKKYQHIFTAKRAQIEENKPVKLFINASGWLGDKVYLTAVLHNLIDTGKFAVNVISNLPAIYENNPYIDKSITRENADYIISQSYNQNWRENCLHIIAGVTKRIADTVNIEIPCKYMKPELYLQTGERLIKQPYIVLNTGWQNSAETKKYYSAYWQQIINLNPGLKFVLIGQSKNHALSDLKNAENWIDKTNINQLCNLIKNADCVISPPSGCVHIAGAYETPCIVLSGGRQPESLTKYENSVYFSALNTMPCCLKKGCHRNKFTDNSRPDKKCEKCKEINGEYTAECMLQIKPEQVSEKLTDILTKKTIKNYN